MVFDGRSDFLLDLLRCLLQLVADDHRIKGISEHRHGRSATFQHRSCACFGNVPVDGCTLLESSLHDRVHHQHGVVVLHHDVLTLLVHLGTEVVHVRQLAGCLYQCLAMSRLRQNFGKLEHGLLRIQTPHANVVNDGLRSRRLLQHSHDAGHQVQGFSVTVAQR